MRIGLEQEKAEMSRKSVEYIHESQFVAEVEVTLHDDAVDWSPAFSFDDARKLDRVRQAMKAGKLKEASMDSRFYEMRPVDSARFDAE